MGRKGEEETNKRGRGGIKERGYCRLMVRKEEGTETGKRRLGGRRKRERKKMWKDGKIKGGKRKGRRRSKGEGILEKNGRDEEREMCMRRKAWLVGERGRGKGMDEGNGRQRKDGMGKVMDIEEKRYGKE